MRTSDGVKKLIKDKGLRQSWIVEQMNRVDPTLSLNSKKFSAIVCGRRKMTGDELIAFCMATDTNPNYFRDAAQDSA